MDLEQIRQAFTITDGERVTALDWDADIAPLLRRGGAVNFDSISSDSQEEMTKSVLDLPGLREASDIVFEISVREERFFKLWMVSLFVTDLYGLPGEPSISWGYTKAPGQEENIKLNILYA